MRYWSILLLTLTISFSQDKGYIDSTMIRDPEIALKLSFIPGFGQFYNGKYLKAIGFITGEYIAVKRFDKFKKNNSISRRNTYAWWIVGLYVLNILDAYVDAQLSTFPIRKLESSNDMDSLRVPIE